MVKHSSELLDVTFGALADPTRRAILERLGRAPCTVSELAAPFPMSLPAVSKHLTVLERAGLIVRRRAGRRQICSLRAAPMQEALAWLEHYRNFWERRLGALETHLAEAGTPGDNPNPDKH